MNKITLGVISDLHYMHHLASPGHRPATAMQGSHADPMVGLLRFIDKYKNDSGDKSPIADFLLCPGDITDRGSKDSFDEGWNQLKRLQNALGARHLISATGNHEVDSRASDEHNKAGNSEMYLDPLHAMQMHSDYPTTAFADQERRWIYWGRGYEFIEEDGVLFLLINSSHYHSTTRSNEFERGRIGDVALKCLREEMLERVDRSTSRVYVAILHHHPIPHQDLDIDLGKIEMDNGAKLMQIFAESNVSWLVVHGHKHHPRLVRGQSSTSAVVFAAGSFGAKLNGTLANSTQPQFYLIDAIIVDQQSQPEAKGMVRAFSWNGSEWQPSIQRNQGLPDRCGYKVPQLDISVLARAVKNRLETGDDRFLEWPEMVATVPNLGFLLPEETIRLSNSLQVAKVATVWPEENWFPTDVSKLASI